VSGDASFGAKAVAAADALSAVGKDDQRQSRAFACWLLLSLRLRTRAGHHGRRCGHLGWRRALGGDVSTADS